MLSNYSIQYKYYSYKIECGLAIWCCHFNKLKYEQNQGVIPFTP